MMLCADIVRLKKNSEKVVQEYLNKKPGRNRYDRGYRHDKMSNETSWRYRRLNVSEIIS